jgi:hypothetical protein
MISGMRWLFLVSVLANVPPLHGAVLAEHVTPHFTFHYPAIDAASIARTGARIETEYARIVDALGVTDMPRVHVTFYTDHAALEAATRAVAGVVPSWAYGLVTAEDQIHCMSPNQPRWGPYDRRLSDVVHEFAHGVTLHLNRTIANNPRWLWEAVAIYEAGQESDPRRLAEAFSEQAPSLSELGALADTRIYGVGYSIGAFVVSRWGAGGLRELVLKNGDTVGALGITPAEFEAQWVSFAKEKVHAARCVSLALRSTGRAIHASSNSLYASARLRSRRGIGRPRPRG